MKLLIIEDDVAIARQLSVYLEGSGYVTILSHEGEEACYLGLEEEYDAILLDIGLPALDGISILEKWRKSGILTPVIIISARGSKLDTIRGLEAGADDYVHKPFDLQEVLARVRSVIRRSKKQLQQSFCYKNVIFDNQNSKVFLDGNYVKLTRIEFLMIQYLFYCQGKVVSISELSEHVYRDFDRDSSIIARHIANIRKKIGPDIIVTEGNRGYLIPRE